MTLPIFAEIDLARKPLRPHISLAKPDRTIVAVLPEAYAISNTIKLGGINELELSLPYELDKNHILVRNKHVDMLKIRYLVKYQLGNYVEWYRIEKINEIVDENKSETVVKLLSLGFELNDKLIRGYSKQSINAEEALLDVLGGTVWNLDYMDSKFLTIYRSFDIPSKTVLDSVFSIAQTFNALVLFDTVNRTISLYSPERIGQDTGFAISYGKYLKSINKDYDGNEVATRLKAYGKDGMTIARVNPTGSDYIEDFSYFMYPFERDENRNVLSHSEYMSDSLCHALLDYNKKVKDNQGVFASLLEQRALIDDQITIKYGEIVALQAELNIILDNIDVAQSYGNNTTQLFLDKAAKESEIDNKDAERLVLIDQLNAIDDSIADKKSEMSPENNFTAEQIKELNLYVIEREWIDDNYFDDEELYNDAVEKLKEIRTPQIKLDIDIVNFKEIVTEQRNWDQLNIGDTVVVRYEKLNLDIKAKIIEITYDYDEKNIKLTISNVTNMKDANSLLLDLLYKSSSSSTTVDMNKFKWNGINKAQNDIDKLLNQTWDASTRAINAGVDETVEINRRGITVSDPNDPNRFLRLMHSHLGLTVDGGNTYRQAITPDGIIGERIMGRILIGNDLSMENDSGALRFDKDGLVVTRSDDMFRTVLNPSQGFNMQKWNGTDWDDKFYVDINGNLIAEDLTAKRLIIDDGSGNILIDGVNGKMDFRNFSEVIMGGSITWTSDSKPSYTAEEIGAKPYDWTPEWGELTGTKPPEFTYIDETGIYTGTLSADKIKGGTISGVTIDITTDASIGNSLRLGTASSNLTLQHYPGYGFYLNRNGNSLLKFYTNALWSSGGFAIPNGSYLGVHQGMNYTSYSSTIYLSQNLTRFWASGSGATTEFYGLLHHRGTQLAFFNSTLSSKQTVAYPSTIATTQSAGSSYSSTEQTMLSNLKTDVGNLRSTLYNLVSALKNYGLV